MRICFKMDDEILIEFLKIRKKNLIFIREQVPFTAIIEDKEEARKVILGRVHEVERLIRKIKDNGIISMIKKEENSYLMNKEKKDREVKEIRMTEKPALFKSRVIY